MFREQPHADEYPVLRMKGPFMSQPRHPKWRQLACLTASLAMITLLAACSRRPVPVSIDLLPQTETGRVEAVFEVPNEGTLKIDFELVSSDAPKEIPDAARIEVWIHEGTAPAVKLTEQTIRQSDTLFHVSHDLSNLTGRTVLLSAAPKGVPPKSGKLRWHRATISGMASGKQSTQEQQRTGNGPPPHVIVYVIDALRADALGCYGRSDTPTPSFDRLAAEGVLYTNALSPSSWTRPATASILTALYPSSHGAVDRPDALSETVLTLAESFRLLGYRTLGVVANGNINKAWGFDQGFDVYVQPEVPDKNPEGKPRRHLHASEVHDTALHHLDQLKNDSQPVFLYIHTVDPHGPYDPPEWLLSSERPTGLGKSEKISVELNTRRRPATPSLMSSLRALYQGEVAYSDKSFGQFREALERRGFLDTAILVLTSDHGEAFQEHGFSSHGMSLFDEELQVPLIIWSPSMIREPSVAYAPVSLLDIAPTLVSMARGEQPSPCHGIVLPQIVTGSTKTTTRALVSELNYDGRVWKAVRSWPYKLLVHHNKGSFQLFNTEKDPRETQDIAASDQSAASRLVESLDAWEERISQDSPTKENAPKGLPDQSVLDNLRVLGYVE